MKRVLTAVVLIPLVLLVVFKAPLWLFSLVVGLLVVFSLHEYLKMMEQSGIEPVRLVTYAVSIFVVVGTFILLASAVHDGALRRYAAYAPEFSVFRWTNRLLDNWAVPVLLPLLFGIPIVFRKELRTALGSAASSAFGVLYIAVPLALLIRLRWTPGSSVLTIFVLASVWAGDIAAYYVGKSIGRHKLAPIVSPNKTWEGAIASVIASIGVAILVFHFYSELQRACGEQPVYWLYPVKTYLGFEPPQSALSFYVIFLGLITNVAAQFGDLFESALKRGAQIKDSGSLLPGHGGILDRIDALLFAIPVVWYYANFQPHYTFYTP
jgi:phosphatidate cytidylyltransferase